VRLPGAGLVTLPLHVAAWTVGALGELVGVPPDEAPTPEAGAPTTELGRLVGEVGEALEGSADVVRELVDDSFGDHRRVWEDHGHAQIEVRSVGHRRQRELRERLKRSLEQLNGVRWAEVNAITSRVAVAFDHDATPLSGLVSVVEAVERAHGVTSPPRHDEVAAWDAPDRADHPADVEPIHRTMAALVGDGLGLGWSVIGRLTRLPTLPIELAGLISLVDSQPWARSQVENRFGRRATELLLPLVTAAANSAAQGPTGIALDLAYRASVLTELQARRAVWCAREAQFYAEPTHETVEPPDLGPRPVPLPPGPVESWSDRIAQLSLGGFAATLAATGDPRRAADAFIAAAPKAARLGREGFATQLGRVLANRGVVPLDASALRRLDRVDTVVVDASTVLNGRHELHEIIGLGEADEDALWERARTMFDPDDVERSTPPDEWRLLPLADLPEEIERPRGTGARSKHLRRQGAVPLALVHDDELVGLAGAVPELDPGAPVLVDAIRRAGHRLVVAGRVGAVARRIDADERIPAGRRMGPAIRRLQGDGAVVAAIVRRGTTGLAAADVGINLQRRSGRPSWGADLLCGPHLTEAAFIIDATTVAAEVSRRSAHLAATGSALGALVALTGPRGSAGRRGLVMVNGAGAAALASGVWSGVALGRRPRPRVRHRVAWHTMTGAEVLDRLDSDADGLSAWEARRRRRQSRHDEPELGVLEPLLAELANPLNPILGVGAGLAAAAGSMVDAGLVTGLIGMNTVVGGVQRLQTERAVASLLRGSANPARVVRDGVESTVTEDDLVRGDVVRLRANDAVPADCRLLDATGLEVDESVLTGESLPVPKSDEPCAGTELAERRCMLYQDTTIATGEATAVVVAVGQDTEVGASLADAADRPATGGVEARLERLTRRILPASAAAAGVVMGAGFGRRWPLRELVGTGVSVAVASVPEGLPFIAGAAQVAAARRLSGRNAVVRDPRTIEALGRVDVLCFDKTGTLTEGRIDLRCLSDGTAEQSVDALDGHGEQILAAALRATPPAHAGPPDTTDAAVLDAAEAVGLGTGRWEVLADLPFEANRGLYAVLGRSGHGTLLAVKGAPESVLPVCVRWRRRGEVQPFDRAALAEVSEHVERLAAQGHRVLAVAERPADAAEDLDPSSVEELELIGLLGLGDPVRATAADAVAGIRAAGVRTVMITGDHPSTASAVAGELDMLDGRRVLTGAELDQLDDDRLAEMIDEVSVFARVTPAHKVRLVAAYQRAGRVVAMTGDGANDAAAIRLAHVGVALGSRGTPAARDAADLVVTDDRIETIIDAIVEGRALWGSVREALAILLGGNLGEIAFTGVASLLSRRAPISPRQFLLVNLFTDLAPALAIAVRPPADTSVEALLREGPEASLGPALTRDIAVRATSTAAGAGGAWLAARMTGTAGRARTVALVALVGTQLGQTMAAGRGRGPLVVATGLGSAAALAAVVQTPGISHFFGCRPLGPLGWAQALTAAGLATAGSVAVSKALRPAAIEGPDPDR
jgi:cation-transporting P-type ATPase I